MAEDNKSKGEVESAIFTAAVRGDDKFVAEYNKDALLRFKTPDVGNSILHIAVRHGHLQFIDKAFSLFSDLLQQENNYGNTPLHEVAMMGNKETVKCLIYHLQNSSNGTTTPVPYLMKVNSDGDTPFHVALRSRNLMVAEELFPYVKEYPEILLMKDKVLKKETPLHLFVRFCADNHEIDTNEYGVNESNIGDTKTSEDQEIQSSNDLQIETHEDQEEASNEDNHEIDTNEYGVNESNIGDTKTNEDQEIQSSNDLQIETHEDQEEASNEDNHEIDTNEYGANESNIGDTKNSEDQGIQSSNDLEIKTHEDQEEASNEDNHEIDTNEYGANESNIGDTKNSEDQRIESSNDLEIETHEDQEEASNEESKQPLICQIIEANFVAIYEHDSQGLNPLMRAAQYGCVVPILVMLSRCPHSMDCRDSKGRSFLHHLRLKMVDLHAGNRYRILNLCKKILEVPGVDTLIFSRDKDGNSPLYLAILDREFEIAEMILERCVEGKLSSRITELITSIKNFEGKTTLDLLASTPDLPPILKNLMNQALQARRGKIISYKKLRTAAKRLDIGLFSEDILQDDDVYVRSRDEAGNNILHMVIHYHYKPFCDDPIDSKYKPFIKKAIKRFPKLMYQKDGNGDTPLHIAARLSWDTAKILFKVSFKFWYAWRKAELTDDDDELDLALPPWKVKDSKGHTPIHEAACTDVLLLEGMIDALNSRDQIEALSDVNDYGENAFHLIARYMKMNDQSGSLDEKDKKLPWSLKTLLDKCKKVGYMRDMDGMTPHLRAASCGRHLAMALFIGNLPKVMTMRDCKARNVLHHLCASLPLSTWLSDFKFILEINDEADDELMLTKDNDGNTPLHLAIINQHFELAHFLIKFYGEAKSSSFGRELKKTRNRDGNTILHYLDSCELGDATANNLKELIVQASGIMDDKIYEAATNGNVEYLRSINVDDFLLRVKTQDGSNILHIALRNNHLPVLEYALDKDYDLIYWKDSKGDTPLHLAATLQTHAAAPTFLEICIQRWKEYEYDERFIPPWKEKNSKGNTYLHEAARLCNYKVIFAELLKDQEINDVNDRGETVLHVIVSYATSKAKKFLENLSEQMKSLIHIQDFEGFTPVLRAVQYGRLGVAMLLIKECPHSVGIPDNKGRTVLHHLKGLVVDLAYEVRDILPVWNLFFKSDGVEKLRIAQNEEGNTPLHSAIIDGDFTKMKFLMEKCLESKDKRELDIVNKEGLSIFDLASSQIHKPAEEELQSFAMSIRYAKEREYIDSCVSRRYVKEREYMVEVMDDGLYKAAITRDLSIFNEPTATDEESRLSIPPKAHFCRKTPGGSNIVHVAFRHGKENAKEFIETAIGKYPTLSMEPDGNGNTPLHLTAKWESAVSIVTSLIKASKNVLESHDAGTKALHVGPWAMKNNKGSFPIHEALQTGNLDAAYALLECDNEAAFRVNDLGDTALHSFAQNGFSIRDYNKAKEFVSALLKRNDRATYMRNDEGLTPLLSAASSGCLQVAKAILECRPQTAYLRDASGRTFLHLLRFTGEDVDESLDGTFKKTEKELFDIPEADAQRLVQDYDGNTPLHHSIIMENSIVAIVLTQKCLQDKDKRELKLVNKQGQTIPDLLAKHDVPNEVIKLIQKKVPEAVNLARSSYGIRKRDMKESANALSVVAALLATITFAAAFQVPGGFSDHGFPNLLEKPVYAIFIVANSIAMCSSMLCLFLLLWVMGIGKIHGSLKVLDISIALIRISFYFTLLTFTSGVFVATPKQSLWLRILVCVLGFLTFLLTFKVSVTTVARCGGYAKSIIKKSCKFELGNPPAANTENSGVIANQTSEQNDGVISEV